MFEREIKDFQTIKRWGIVRTLIDQSLAEHSFCVAMYANDLCCYLGLAKPLHLAVLQYALWHDGDELFTGDAPGPNKRALFVKESDTKERWDKKLKLWMAKTFKVFTMRSGTELDNSSMNIVKAVVKVADWLDASMQMAMELQMGNQNAAPAVYHNREKAKEALSHLLNLLEYPETHPMRKAVADEIDYAVRTQYKHHSSAPWLNVSESPYLMADNVK